MAGSDSIEEERRPEDAPSSWAVIYWRFVDGKGRTREHAYGIPYTCAACGRRLEDQVDVPLVLWRREGAEILTLHWECAQLRMISVGQRN